MSTSRAPASARAQVRRDLEGVGEGGRRAGSARCARSAAMLRELRARRGPTGAPGGRRARTARRARCPRSRRRARRSGASRRAGSWAAGRQAERGRSVGRQRRLASGSRAYSASKFTGGSRNCGKPPWLTRLRDRRARVREQHARADGADGALGVVLREVADHEQAGLLHLDQEDASPRRTWPTRSR